MRDHRQDQDGGLFEAQWKTHFDQWLKPFWGRATPGLCFEVYRGGRLWAQYQGGETYPLYDLASLTKVLFTVPALMRAHANGWWTTETLVKEILPWWPHEKIKIVDILTHSSGLLWWKPFYQDLIHEATLSGRWQLLQKELESSVLQPSSKSVYSDVGFLSLAFVLEGLWKRPLLEIWKEVKSEFAPQSGLHWRTTPLRLSFEGSPREERSSSSSSSSPDTFKGSSPQEAARASIAEASADVALYAPTEHCPWRGRRIRGEVHDENAWTLGGVSSHAGLFGNCQDAAQVFLTFREAALNPLHPLHATVNLFTKRQTPPEQGDWGLGFVLPTPGQSTGGQYLSPHSVGHTGFTGTSVWWDLDKDLLIVILSNRVFLGREKREFAKLRPLLHDEIILMLERSERN